MIKPKFNSTSDIIFCYLFNFATEFYENSLFYTYSCSFSIFCNTLRNFFNLFMKFRKNAIDGLFFQSTPGAKPQNISMLNYPEEIKSEGEDSIILDYWMQFFVFIGKMVWNCGNTFEKLVKSTGKFKSHLIWKMTFPHPWKLKISSKILLNTFLKNWWNVKKQDSLGLFREGKGMGEQYCWFAHKKYLGKFVHYQTFFIFFFKL